MEPGRLALLWGVATFWLVLLQQRLEGSCKAAFSVCCRWSFEQRLAPSMQTSQNHFARHLGGWKVVGKWLEVGTTWVLHVLKPGALKQIYLMNQYDSFFSHVSPASCELQLWASEPSNGTWRWRNKSSMRPRCSRRCSIHLACHRCHLAYRERPGAASALGAATIFLSPHCSRTCSPGLLVAASWPNGHGAGEQRSL